MHPLTLSECETMSVASAHIDDHLTLQGLNEPGRVLTRLGGAFAHTTAIAK